MHWRNLLPVTAALALLAGVAILADEKKPADGAGPAIKVSGPFSHANLSIFLLHGKDTMPAGHSLLTLQEALEQKKAVVHETSNVNELSIENVSADMDVFVQSGDIVRGGKQDRLMACDMIVPPKSGKIPIASFCCESGRWQQRGGENAAAFGESSKQAANKDVKLAVNAARDQGQVWQRVKESQQKLQMNVGKSVANKASPTSYQLSLEDKELMAKLAAYESELKKVIDAKDDVIGFVIVINGKVEGAEVYGSSALFRKLWPKLINAAAVDALSELKKDAKFAAATAKDVEKFLADAEQGKQSEVVVNRSNGRDRQALNPAPNADRQSQTSQPPSAQAPASPSAPANSPNARLALLQRDGDKILMLESKDKKAGNAVVHRSYIAK